MAAGGIVDTTAGPVRGMRRDGIEVFRGIPYAEAPTGGLRFRPPARRTPWTEPRDCSHAGPVAPQNAGTMESLLGAPPPAHGDDCLSLNIWTPAADDGKRPVLVWIHGGAFVSGSGATPWYDGTRFATQHDVVVVTINYRLGALGFLHLADVAGPEWEGAGNLGVLDQAFALRWVSENIASFGGDPANVTIFGESAGGMSVGTQLGLPEARGLFRRAIAQSGAAGHVHDRESATRVALRLLDALGLEVADASQLQQLPLDSILAAQETVNRERSDLAGAGLPFMPCVDGTTLPVAPQQAVAGGHAAGIDLVVGSNLDEMTLFTMMDPRLGDLDDATLVRRFGGLVGEERAAETIDAYRKDRSDARAADIWNAALADRVFRAPAVRLADAQHQHAPTFVYLFTWPSKAFEGRLRSCHALEIPFVFDNLDRRGVSFFTGDVDEEMRDLARMMNTAWATFARTGVPTAPGLPEWPVWESESRPTMVLGSDRAVEHDPAGHELAVWMDLI